MYEVFEHTADVGLHLRSDSLAGLLEDAARGLFEIVAGDLEQVRPAIEERFEVAGSDPEYLLLDWLAELLYAFATRRMLFTAFEVEVGPEGLRARARGEPFDPGRHVLAHEVKAITYHGLKVESGPRGWVASVIVDI